MKIRYNTLYVFRDVVFKAVQTYLESDSVQTIGSLVLIEIFLYFLSFYTI